MKKIKVSPDKFGEDNNISTTITANIILSAAFSLVAVYPSPLPGLHAALPICNNEDFLILEENSVLIHLPESSSPKQYSSPPPSEKMKTGNSLFDFLGIHGDNLQPPLLESAPIPTLKRYAQTVLKLHTYIRALNILHMVIISLIICIHTYYIHQAIE